MAKVDLGEKIACPECEKKFYDLTKTPALCPYCAHSFDPAAAGVKAPVVAASNVDEPEEEAADTEDEVDEDEAAAKELELDGDSATFSGNSGDDEDDDSSSAPDMDGFSTNDDDDDDETSALDDDDDKTGPPTQNEDEEVEEVEI